MVESITLTSGDRSATITKDSTNRTAAARTAFVDAEEAPAIVPDGISGHVTSSPEAHPWVPPDDGFEDGDDFMGAREVQTIGEALIARYPEFAFLRDDRYPVTIEYFWKRKGGKSGGKTVFGKCLKPSGLLKHVTGDTFIIWIAADHLRDARLTNLQLEALVYHELKHCSLEIDDDETSPTYGEIKYVVVAHDNELFTDELRRYGAWQPDLKRLQRTEWAQLAING